MAHPADVQVLRRLRVTPAQLLLAMDTPWNGAGIKSLLLRSGLGFHLRRGECITGGLRMRRLCAAGRMLVRVRLRLARGTVHSCRAETCG
jgi:hypothetical protein